MMIAVTGATRVSIIARGISLTLVAITVIVPQLALTIVKAAALFRAEVAAVSVEGEIIQILAGLAVIRTESALSGDFPFQSQFRFKGTLNRDLVIISLEQMAVRAQTG
jgi:hypothetical protein